MAERVDLSDPIFSRRDQLGRFIGEAELRATKLARHSRWHGGRHWTDVAHMALMQIQAGASRADPAVCIAFAAVHDTQRQDEGRAVGHGERAAQLCLRLSPFAGDRCLDFLTPHSREVLRRACRLHSGSGIQQFEDEVATIQVCINADRYTLWRVGDKPDLRRMASNLPELTMRGLRDYAHELVRSEGFGWREILDQWEHLRTERIDRLPPPRYSGGQWHLDRRHIRAEEWDRPSTSTFSHSTWR